jgi:hypothetical protein
MVWGDFARGERQKLPEFTRVNLHYFQMTLLTRNTSEPTDILFVILNLLTLSGL